MHRRRLLRTGAAAASGIVAGTVLPAQRAEANTGGALILGQSNDADASTVIVASNPNRTFSALNHADHGIGVYGEAYGGGVVGLGLGGGDGVFGQAGTSSGWNVHGAVAGTSEKAIGVSGGSYDVAGVSGLSQRGSGVTGWSQYATGVSGASAAGNGVQGDVANSFNGVYGHNAGNGNGVFGEVASGTGNALLGITSGSGSAVLGLANAGATGVIGRNDGSGPAMLAVINNTSNASTALQAATSGKGTAILATNSPTATTPTIKSSSSGTPPALHVIGKPIAAGASVPVAGNAAAIQVQGVATFTRSGKAKVAPATTSIVVSVPGGLSASSHVLATMQTNTNAVLVRAAVPNSATGKVTIYLTGPAPVGGVNVAWFVFG